MEKSYEFGFELNESEGYWTVTYYNSDPETVLIPASHEGKPVKAIGQKFASQTSIGCYTLDVNSCAI